MISRSNTLEYIRQLKIELELLNLSAYNFLVMDNPTYDTCEAIKKKFPNIYGMKYPEESIF